MIQNGFTKEQDERFLKEIGDIKYANNVEVDSQFHHIHDLCNIAPKEVSLSFIDWSNTKGNAAWLDRLLGQGAPKTEKGIGMLRRVTSMNQTNMTSREIITRVIERKDAPRIGFNFNYPHQNDFRWQGIAGFENHYEQYSKWGRYPEILAKVPGFNGEVRVDALGNICGRVGKDHNGECIKGVLQDDWELLDSFEFPEFDQAKIEALRAANLDKSGRFITCVPPVSVFSTLRDARLMDNALMDTVLEPESVSRFLMKVQKVLLKSVELAHSIGGQALFVYDDWGMQHAPFISPNSFAELFKPVYKAVADELHNRNMKFFLHSCGMVWDFIPHFIEAGIDVLQFDQPELSGSENLARTFGKQVTIYSPVDIQKIMATGNRELIEATAHNMVEVFKKYADGALIAKDYPTWEDIMVKQEWATWARDIFLREGWNK